MTDLSPLLALGSERYVILTTFRRSGEPVGTPVWIARYRNELLVTTPEGTGKLKRLRNDTRVEVQPASRFGKPKRNTSPISATVVSMEEETPALADFFRTKYGLEYRIFMLFERRGKSAIRHRVVLHIA